MRYPDFVRAFRVRVCDGQRIPVLGMRECSRPDDPNTIRYPVTNEEKDDHEEREMAA